MAWLRPEDADVQAGTKFRYTNAGEHAIGQPDIATFIGVRDDEGTWFSWPKHKGPRQMSKPQFIWRDDPVPADPVEPPKPGTDWLHRNGNEYGVLLLTNVDSERPEYPPTVVYVNKGNGKWYSRPIADWHRSMTEVEDDG